MKNAGNILTKLNDSFRRAAIRSFCAICILLTVACERRPLEDPDNFVNFRITIDTRAINNVSHNIYNDRIPVPEIDPEVMHVLFFEEDGDRLATEAFISDRSTNSEGNTVISGDVQIYPGRYKMIVYNFGTESTIIRDYNSWSKATAYTNRVADNIISSYRSKFPEEDADNITYEPDHLLVYTDSDLFIPYHSGTPTVSATASTIIDSYYLQIKVEGLQYVSHSQAFLSGMSGGNVLSENRRRTETPKTIYFSLNKSKDNEDDVICNVFSTFGRIPDSENRLEVTFDLKTLDGKSIQKTFDITDVFKTKEAIEKHWLLIDESIVVPPPEKPSTGGGGGMQPSVSDWEDENHDIIL